MRAMRIEALGQELAMAEVAVPVPGPGEVLVRVRACGLNFADTLMVAGRYQERPALPFAPGIEVCGTVAARGPGVVAPGEGVRVAGLCGAGGLADYVVLPAAGCAPVPEAMSDEAAAGFLVAYGTSHIALAELARLRPGETLLVTGAAGGVGLTAVELGALMGARVLAVARGEEKRAVAAGAGAQATFDAGADIAAEVKALGGADVVYETVGGAVFEAALAAARPGARVLPIGFAGGEVPRVPANRLLVKNQTVIGFYFGAWVRMHPAAARGSLEALMAWHGMGRLRPHVGHVLPLAAANEGLRLLRERAATGKVVVRIE
ncbi:MAG TPA: NADPH:quinone oxidoreductase family protein [Amaricoccus sp.]|uniref:NADPH:quinone oxidoreductase family protein n=1 Tax=Amaricoccus sp. TaxID=1872485 RepID=UPI002B623A8C|nr:NADPH:quinone oxidoreductase family protein [Amaricoccus sp.]HRO10131.1 NADPH:quinone oxidoreductase family protein [Amaricoccus sp.]